MLAQFRKHQDWVLAVVALILIGGLAGAYVWGINRIVDETSSSFEIRLPTSLDVKIDIAGAKRLFEE